MDSSFTDVEKVRCFWLRACFSPAEPPPNRPVQRFVLAEMIKVSQIDVHALVELVRSYEVDPDWMSMQLPNGKPPALEAHGAVEETTP